MVEQPLVAGPVQSVAGHLVEVEPAARGEDPDEGHDPDETYDDVLPWSAEPPVPRTSGLRSVQVVTTAYLQITR